MKRQLVLLSVLLALCGVSTGNASVSIDVQIHNAAVVPGGTTSIEVWLAARGGDIDLASFGFELGITQNEDYGIDSVLEFVDFDNPFDIPSATDQNYVFKGVTELGPFGMALPGENGFELFSIGWFGADIVDESPGFVTLEENKDYLLARLNLKHSFSVGFNSVGNQFTVGLIEGADTLFLDNQFGDIDFTSSSGTVSVIPEPGSLLIFVGLGLCAIPYLRRRSRRAQRA